jgi:hypothetical protein
MKLMIILSFLCAIVLCQELKPLDFDMSEMRDIWESPELQPSLKNVAPNYKPTNREGRISGGIQAQVFVYFCCYN